LSIKKAGENEMERIINIHIEKLPEEVYLATSDDVPGLVAQGRTVSETLEIARDVARRLLETREERMTFCVNNELLPRHFLFQQIT
jgi:predicted RNase H-like HicB family nuclease